MIQLPNKICPRAGASWPQRAIYWPELSSHGSTIRDIEREFFTTPEADGMPKENDEPAFEGCNPATLFREFAAECMELAQTNSSPEKHALYLKMASVWQSDGAALGKENRAVTIGSKQVSSSTSRGMPLWDTAMIALVDRIYHCLLLLGSHSGHWQGRLGRTPADLTRLGHIFFSSVAKLHYSTTTESSMIQHRRGGVRLAL